MIIINLTPEELDTGINALFFADSNAPDSMSDAFKSLLEKLLEAKKQLDEASHQA